MAKKKSEPADDAPPATQTLAALERLSRLLRQASHGGGLIPVQWEALRYLAKANRLSNTPGALAKYLASTKGTVSQTVAALETKGLVTKQARPGNERSVNISLTPKAAELLTTDPLMALLGDITDLNPKTQRRMGRGLQALLNAEASRQMQPRFGGCETCRFFREGGVDAPDRCMKDNAIVDELEINRLCVEFTPR
jgi:DNA-binding MarR family transcriptional regulator